MFTPGAVITRDFSISGPKGGIAGEVRGRDNRSRPSAPALGGVQVVLTDHGDAGAAARRPPRPTATFRSRRCAAGTSHDYVLTFTRAGYDTATTLGRAVAANPTTFVAVEMQAAGRAVTSRSSPRPRRARCRRAARRGDRHGHPARPERPGRAPTDANGQRRADPASRQLDVDAPRAPPRAASPGSAGAAPRHLGDGERRRRQRRGPPAPTIRLAGPFASATGTVNGRANPAATAVPISGADRVDHHVARHRHRAQTDANGGVQLHRPTSPSTSPPPRRTRSASDAIGRLRRLRAGGRHARPADGAGDDDRSIVIGADPAVDRRRGHRRRGRSPPLQGVRRHGRR